MKHLLFTTCLLAGNLSALDHNSNGISDVWESRYPAAAAASAGDEDKDGISNAEEGKAFTDPTDPASLFNASILHLETTMEITFPGERWMRDLTQSSSNLSDWVRESPPVQSDGTSTTSTLPSNPQRSFVRRVRYLALNSDTDALTNKEEELLGTNPLKWDTDNDHVADDIEFLQGTDPLSLTDTDNDSLPDDFERWCLQHEPDDGFTTLADIDTTTDFDGDTITDGQEFALGTSPVTPVKNILFFITEDQSVHLGLYDTNPAGGYAGDSPNPADNRTRGLDTPHIDAFGNSGLIFDRAFCLSPVCSPSKMALYTGTFPHTNSAHRNVQNYGINFPLPSGNDPSLLNLGGVHEDLPTLIEIFNDRGWFTAVSSKSHVQPVRKFPYQKGYPSFSTPASATNTVDAVITAAGARPFFLWANVGSPHLPFAAVPKVNGTWNPTGGLTGDGGVTNVDPNAIDVPNCYPDEPGVRQDIADYLGAIENIDGVVKACLDTLVARGVDDETLVIFTSDHGIGLHRAKQSIYSAGLQIPFLVAGPGVVSGRRLRTPISHLDIAPTFTDLIGMPKLPSHSGKSLVPLFTADSDTIPGRSTMLTACHRYYNARSVTDGKYYYVRNITKPAGTLANPALALNTDQYQGGSPWFNRTYDATLGAAGSIGRDLLIQTVTGVGLPDEELFDLDQDLWCVNNIIDEPAHAATLVHLRQEMSEWRTTTEDYNTDSSELVRRTNRCQPPTGPPSGNPTDTFDGKSGSLGNDPDWTLSLPGNNGADFTFASNQVTAPAGPLTLGTYQPETLSNSSTFIASVKTGFNGTGVGSGVAFGIIDDGGSSSFWQFMLADGRSTPGGPAKDVRLIRVTQGIPTATLIAQNSLDDYPTAGGNNGDLFTVEVSGTSGSAIVDLRIFHPSGALYYENSGFDLGLPIPNGSRFGLTSWSSSSSIFDDFRLQISSNGNFAFDFEASGNLNEQANWSTLAFGNNNADFTFVTEPFGNGGQSLKAAAGPSVLASYDSAVLGENASFSASLDVGYPSSGIFGGLTFGLTDSNNWFSFELANGNTINGLAQNRLLRIRRSDGGTVTTLLSPAVSTLPIISQNRFYRLTVTGTQGSTTITYEIVDALTDDSLANGTFALGAPIPSGSRFGVIANSSGSTHFDSLRLNLN
jgi:N-sulfoglucosamine sulfohydrolase